MVPDLALIDSDHVPNIARLAALAYACHRGLRLVLGNGFLQLPPLTSRRSLCKCAHNPGRYPDFLGKGVGDVAFEDQRVHRSIDHQRGNHALRRQHPYKGGGVPMWGS